jgi:hypothetical protein
MQNLALEDGIQGLRLDPFLMPSGYFQIIFALWKLGKSIHLLHFQANQFSLRQDEDKNILQSE